jgi:hypothetical protein
LSFTVSCSMGNPIVYNRAANGFANGHRVYLSGTSYCSPLASGVGYFIVGVSGNNLSLSLNPGGSAINSDGVTSPSGTQSVYEDIGDDIIYLNAGTYSWGNNAENLQRTAAEYLLIEPSPGTLKSAVTIYPTASTKGLNVPLVHLFNVNVRDAISGDGALQGKITNLWVDSVTDVGNGHLTDSGGVSTLGPFQNLAGIFATNLDLSQFVSGIAAALIQNSIVHDQGEWAYSASHFVVNSTGVNIGLDVQDPVTTLTDTPSGATIQFPVSGAGSLPPLISNTAPDGPWIVGAVGTRPACIPSNAVVSSVNLGAGTLTMNVPVTCDVPAHTTFDVGTIYHTDFQFTYQGGNNQIMLGNTATSYIPAQGIFYQNGTYFDEAIIGNSFTITGPSVPLLIESPTINLYALNNAFLGTKNRLTGT